MINNRILLQILAAMTKKERKHFREFLECSYFNSNPLLINLLLVFDHWLSGSRKKELTFEVVRKKIGIAASTLEKSMSQTLTLLRKFILEEELRRSQVQDHGQVLNWLHQRGLENKWLEMESRKYAKKQSLIPKSVEGLYEEFTLSHSVVKIRSGLPRVGGESMFKDSLLKLEVFYVVSRLKYTCATLNEWRVFGGNKPEVSLDKILERLIGIGGLLPSLGEAYRRILTLLESDSPPLEQVREMLDFMENNGGEFSQEDTFDLFSYLLNSCFRGVDLGQKEKSELVYNIYISMLDRGLLTTGRYMNSGHFKNLVSLKARSGRLESARKFIEDYASFLSPEDQEILRTYTLGVVSFYAEDYSEAIALFKDVLAKSPEDLFWSIESRIMIWRAYFESYEVLDLPEQDEMDRNYNAFRISIARNKKLSAYHKSCYQNYIRIFYRLIQQDSAIKGPEQVEQLKGLYKEADGLKELANKKWLMEAISRRIELRTKK